MTSTSSPDPDLLPIDQGPRVILYHQTHHKPDSDEPVSLIPLLTNAGAVTHIIIAAFHLNDEPGDITLNDHPPSHSRNDVLWAEVAWLRASGVKVLAMLGGAAKGTFARLDTGDAAVFEAFYNPLRDILHENIFDGVDLDVEEPMSLPGIIRLIDRFRMDFGKDFLITLAPTATALLPGQPHLSGFSYHSLVQQRGHEVAWLNAQFYNGWGDASTTFWYDAIMTTGWPADKVVLGILTNARLGSGFVPWGKLEGVLRTLRGRYPSFGGVMGWEYFCAEPGGEDAPWEWADKAGRCIRGEEVVSTEHVAAPGDAQGTLPVGAPLPEPAHPFPAESVKTLQDLGFGSQQAVAALNMTSGNVEQAASLLFAD